MKKYIMAVLCGVCGLSAQADEVVAGWDFGSSVNATYAMDSIATSQIIGSLQTRTNTWNSIDVGSNDGTYGTGTGLDSSPLDQAPGTGTGLLVIGNNAATNVFTVLNRFTVQNNTGADLELTQIQFDYFRDGEGAHSNLTVSVESGSGITVGQVYDSGLIAVDSGDTWSDFPDYMIDLTGLADHTLANGESVTFRVRHFSSDKTGNGLFDNFAVTGIPGEAPEGLVIDDVYAGRAGDDTNEDTLDGLGDAVNYIFPLDVGTFVAGDGVNTHPVFVFQMTGTANPADITDANFSVSLLAKQNPTYNVDAHVIRTSSSNEVLASDYETSAALLMGGFNTPADAAEENYGLDTTGQETFTTWLQNNWVENEYLFIGLKSDPTILPDPGTEGSQNIFYRYGGNTPDGWTAGKTDAQLTISISIVDPYTLWAQDNGVGGMEEDFDEDGLNNLAEYALNGDPTDPNDQGLAAVNASGGTFEYVHAMLSDPNSGVEYIVEVNDMGDLVLGGWTNTGITVTSGALDAEYDLVTNAIPTGGTQNFIRLQINGL